MGRKSRSRTCAVSLLLLSAVFLVCGIDLNVAQNPTTGSTVTTVDPAQSGIPVRKSLVQNQASALDPQTGTGRLGKSTAEGGSSATKANDKLASGAPTGSNSFHIMAEDHSGCTAINPKTSFLTSDYKAEIDYVASVSSSYQTQFAYRSDNSRDWLLYYDSGVQPLSGTYCISSFIYVSGQQAASLSPRAFMVRVYLDGNAAFDEFFDVSDHNFSNSLFVTATGVDANGNPINPGKATFTVGQDQYVYAYVGINNAAFCSEPNFGECRDTNGHVHDLYVAWYHGGAFDHDVSVYWGDYKNQNLNYNYWSLIYDNGDYMSVDVSKVGTWDVYFYLDAYYNGGTYYWYGPVAHIQFTVQATSTSPWTVMAYLDGDNNLESYAIAKFLSMSQVGSSSNVKLLAELDRTPGYDTSYGDWTSTKRFFITNGMTPTSANAIQDLGEQNMGDLNALSAFISWAVQNYPADRYFLILFDHGSGAVQMRQMAVENVTSLGIMFDDTDQDALTTPELAQALSTGGATISVIYLDACTMGGLEVGYQIASYADVMVASEEVGWASMPDPVYSTFLTSLVSNPSMTSTSLATDVVNAYADAWSGGSNKITCAAIDLTRLRSSGLVPATDSFSSRLQEKYASYSGQIQNARSGSEGFEGPYGGNLDYYVDLYDLADRVFNAVPDTDLRSAASSVRSNLLATVVAFRQYNHPNAHGLSIFFPDTQSKYQAYRTTYRATSFAATTNWDEWLDAYYAPITVTATVTLTETSTSYQYGTTTTTSTSYTSTTTSASTITTVTTVALVPLTITSTEQSTQFLTSVLATTTTDYTSTTTSTITIPTTVALVPSSVTSTVQSTQYLTSILTTTVTNYTSTETSTSTILVPTSVVLIPLTATSTEQSTQYLTSTATTTVTIYTDTQTVTSTIPTVTTVVLLPSTVTSTTEATQYLTSILTTTETSYTATTTSTSTSVVYTTVTESPEGAGPAGAGASSPSDYLGFLSLLTVAVVIVKPWKKPEN